MSKKFALCFSGFPRFVSKSFPSIKSNLIDSLDGNFDIFASFQWKDGLENERVHHEFDKKFSGNELEDFIKLYEPFNLKTIDTIKPYSQDEFKFSKGSAEPDLPLSLQEAKNIFFRLKSQYNCICNCLELFDPKEYEYIIRLRTDLIFHQKIDLSQTTPYFILNQSGRVAGADRIFSDWFFVCPTSKIQFFYDLSDLNTHFKDGIIHMHKLVEKVGLNYNLSAMEFCVDTPSTLKNPSEYFG